MSAPIDAHISLILVILHILYHRPSTLFLINSSALFLYSVVTLTPDQIRIRLGQLQAQKSFLQTIGSYAGAGCDIGNQVSTSTTAYNGKVESLKGNSTTVMTKRCKCIVDGGDNANCDEFQQALDLSLENAEEVAFRFQGKAALEAIQSGNKDAVDAMIRGIDEQIEDLTEQLRNSPSVLSEVGKAAEGITGGKAPTGPWLYFQWTSEQSDQKETSSQSSFSTQTSFSASFGLFSIGGSFGYSKSTANAFSSLKQSRVKVAGELMRVSVQMPWFRPELFRNEHLTLVSCFTFNVIKVQLCLYTFLVCMTIITGYNAVWPRTI